jgi:DNA-binding LacI/PurR family transcriptional regulator
MRSLLDTAPDLDAVVVGNDRMALGAMRVLERAGRRIPDDVAVTGFDNTPEAAWTSPSLTSVDQPLQEMGRRAVQVVLEHRDNPGAPVEVASLACTVMVRESTVGPTAAPDLDEHDTD